MEFSTFSHELQELATKYRKWVEPVSELTKIYLRDHNVPAQDYETRLTARNEVLTELRKKNDVQGELTAFLDNCYELYYTATPVECQKLRESIAINREFEDFLLSYAQDVANRIHSADDIDLLKRGFVALSLENSGRDFRDTLTTLADLYVSAESAGIDPKPLFIQTAEISSKERPRGGTTPLEKMLRDFDTYAIVPGRRYKGKNVW